ncbi:hypothetical protein C5167_039562 [Papaver somniferum]|uniref:Uncharacterized protein n=1 Tax=Papaver somniferum TaxID=3469 RepID=A0A4Y7ICG7_PAPSO|nr:hypothetical protein C5167_039562 [Papaver somniferum]
MSFCMCIMIKVVPLLDQMQPVQMNLMPHSLPAASNELTVSSENSKNLQIMSGITQIYSITYDRRAPEWVVMYACGTDITGDALKKCQLGVFRI